MNEEHAVRAASASLVAELGAALRQATAQVRADDATARRSADDHTSSRLVIIDRRLEEIATKLPPPASSASAMKSHRVGGLYLGPITAVMVLGFLVVLSLAGAIGGKLVGDRAYATGQAAGYAQAAAFERDHPAQWRAYQTSQQSASNRLAH